MGKIKNVPNHQPVMYVNYSAPPREAGWINHLAASILLAIAVPPWPIMSFWLEGPVWHTIYHHWPVVRGSLPHPSIFINQWEFGTSPMTMETPIDHRFPMELQPFFPAVLCLGHVQGLFPVAARLFREQRLDSQVDWLFGRFVNVVQMVQTCLMCFNFTGVTPFFTKTSYKLSYMV